MHGPNGLNYAIQTLHNKALSMSNPVAKEQNQTNQTKPNQTKQKKTKQN